MPATNFFHCLANAPLVPQPPPTVPMSATTPSGGSVQTVRLLDPAPPPVGATQQTELVTFTMTPAATYSYCFGRWVTRPLAAQSISAGNWSAGGVLRLQDTGVGSTTSRNLGFTVVQWRPSSAAPFIPARAVDSPGGGLLLLSATGNGDLPFINTVAGSGLTLLAGDCLVLELWAQLVTSGAAGTFKESLCFNGVEQYVSTPPSTNPPYAVGALTNTDLWLLAPSAVSFQ
jgi:hypothetical protein